jgi:hypothetical protein
MLLLHLPLDGVTALTQVLTVRINNNTSAHFWLAAECFSDTNHHFIL